MQNKLEIEKLIVTLGNFKLRKLLTIFFFVAKFAKMDPRKAAVS